MSFCPSALPLLLQYQRFVDVLIQYLFRLCIVQLFLHILYKMAVIGWPSPIKSQMLFNQRKIGLLFV